MKVSDIKYLLSKKTEETLKNERTGTFLYLTNDLEKWLDKTSNSGRRLVSPGGIAAACHVTRQAVYNWYLRDQSVTAFVCYQKVFGYWDTFVLVDLDESLDLCKKK